MSEGTYDYELKNNNKCLFYTRERQNTQWTRTVGTPSKNKDDYIYVNQEYLLRIAYIELQI